MKKKYSLFSHCIVTPDKVIENSYLNINAKKIASLSSKSENNEIINLDDKIIFPALVDAHDHLFGTYYPKIGATGGKYQNWKPWDDDLKSSPVYAERSKIPPTDIYELGVYKHVISGCLTVSDHMPHEVADKFIKDLPIRVQKKYALAHEASSFDLRWGDGIVAEHTKALKENIPFITHIEEGFDEESKKGIDILLLLKALSDHTVLVHGLGLSKADIKAIAQKKAHLVWCPGSNYFMFKLTGDVKNWIKAGINVSLGTDSPASGELNLLYEMKFAKKLYKKIYKEEISDKTLVQMATINPAKALRLDKEIGSLEKGKIADFIAISGNPKKPYSSLVKADFKDIDLVVYEGLPMYGSVEHEDLFKKFDIPYNKVKIAGTNKIINGDPKALMKRIRKYVGFKKEIPFLPVE